MSLLQGALPGPNHPEISHRFTDVQFLREPTDFETGREIRKRLAAPSGTDRNEWIDLFLRDRADNVARNIRPLLASGALILQDRYYYSTAAYQGDESKPPHPVEIVDMNLPVQACFHNVAFVSIRKRYPGHAYKAMNTLWGLGALAFTKFVFVVDEDANVQDVGEMLFRIGANCDPGRDTLISKGPVDQLDHAAQEMGFGGKIGFDCTHKWPGENGFARDYPKLITMSEDVKRRVDELWPRLGL
ncbi:MAG: UbiD family decarboxylase [Fimbriimonas ginsengisoli]|nr:UbiD family decarboxylase [Fimbriimonas ginsengisoli]